MRAIFLIKFLLLGSMAFGRSAIIIPKKQDAILSIGNNKSFALDSTFRCYWDTIMLTSMVYFFIASPIRVQNGISTDSIKEFETTLIFDYFLDVLFVLDIFLKLTVFARNLERADRDNRFSSCNGNRIILPKRELDCG